MPFEETIVAQSTAHGSAAIAMVRASGPLCPPLAQSIFKKNTAPAYRQATVGFYQDLSGKTVDQVVYCLYPSTHSYTGESMLEIACHGNPLIVHKIVEDLIARGCRLAQGGEFTKTAFLNGKLDLTQAEAVSDIIIATSEAGIEAARKQLTGQLGEKINAYTDALIQLIAEIEAYIDFPDEDLPAEDRIQLIINMKQMIQNLDTLSKTNRYKAFLQEGIKTAIVGPPNAGKSSLFNALLGEDRAIVSEIPGTTRDFIAEKIYIGSYCLRIMDTAGVRDTSDAIETLGIQKTLEKINECDLCLLVLDVSQPDEIALQSLLQKVPRDKTLIIENKIDLVSENPCQILGKLDKKFQNSRLSLKTNAGFSNFKKELELFLKKLVEGDVNEGMVVNARHSIALKEAVQHIEEGTRELEVKGNYELAASELHQAIEALGEIVGKIDNEAILDKLFKTFCIGK